MVEVLLGFRKKRKMRKLVSKYIDKRIDQKRSFEEQLGKLDDQLKKEKIDLQERDRTNILASNTVLPTTRKAVGAHTKKVL